MSLESQADNLPYNKSGSLTFEELSALYDNGPSTSKHDGFEPPSDTYVPLAKNDSLPFDDEAKHSTKSSDHDTPERNGNVQGEPENLINLASYDDYDVDNVHNEQPEGPSKLFIGEYNSLGPSQPEHTPKESLEVTMDTHSFQDVTAVFGEAPKGPVASLDNAQHSSGTHFDYYGGINGHAYGSFGGTSPFNLIPNFHEENNNGAVNKEEGSPGMVVRNDHYCSQRATVSFGVEPPRNDADVLDVVNYYKPNTDDAHTTPQSHANEYRGCYAQPKTSDWGTPVGDQETMLPSEGFPSAENEAKSGARLYGKNGRLRGHVGGDSTTSSILVNARAARSEYTDTSPYNTLFDSDAQNGLFEVPFNVYSVPRLVDPFKGFSKIHTQRAIKFLHLSKVNDKLVCKLDKSASKLLKKQIGNCKVVSTSIVGDPRSGKSYLAGLLVGKGSKSFKISEPFAVQTKCEGTVWIYVAVYEEKYAYLFLDFDGFEGSDADRIKMLSFALAASNCVLASFKASVMSGVFELVQSMINLLVVDDEESERSEDEENDIVEIFRKKTTKLFIRGDDDDESEQSKDDLDLSEIGDNLWSPPIIHFIFRDSNDFIRCLDERNYTPETLVEQGIFEHYLDIFKCASEDNMEFKNNMLDAFGVFTNRKYTCLPYPIRPRKRSDAGRSAVGQMLLNFLAPNEAKDARIEDDNYPVVPTQNISLMPMGALSNHFFERLDEIKTCVYQDTLTHARANSHLSGRMFVRFMKLLVEHFNVSNVFTIKDVNAILTRVHFDENESVKKDSIIYFLKIIKSKVAPLLPINSRELLSRSMQVKQKALKYFESRAFGSFKDYSKVYDALARTLDELVAKLDKKNTSIINHKITAFVERRADLLNYRIARREYTPEDLDAEILKTKRALQRRFNDAAVVDSALIQVSQKLVEIFNHHHPDVYIARIHATSIEDEFGNIGDCGTSGSFMTVNSLSGDVGASGNVPEENGPLQVVEEHRLQDGSMGEDHIDAHVDETTPHTLSEDPTPQSTLGKRVDGEKRVTIAERPVTITRVY